MNKHKWETAWEDKKFSIKTLTPSILVSKYEKLLENGDTILDIGCGNGRNSIYLASKGYKVDCFDVADLGWQEKLPPSILKNIDFKKSDVLEYPYKASRYKTIVVARVIQYLNSKELSFLIDKIRYSIQPNGFLLLSYNSRGGIFDKESIEVPKYSYSVDEVVDLLKAVFGTVVASEGSKRSQHVNYEDDILTFDIFASDPRI